MTRNLPNAAVLCIACGLTLLNMSGLLGDHGSAPSTLLFAGSMFCFGWLYGRGDT